MKRIGYLGPSPGLGCSLGMDLEIHDHMSSNAMVLMIDIDSSALVATHSLSGSLDPASQSR